jgi:hypothetical protein
LQSVIIIFIPRTFTVVIKCFLVFRVTQIIRLKIQNLGFSLMCLSDQISVTELHRFMSYVNWYLPYRKKNEKSYKIVLSVAQWLYKFLQ